MWQVEDLMRACDLDINTVDETVLLALPEEDGLRAKAREWYIGIIASIQDEKLEKQGHLGITRELVGELTYLHHTLLTIINDEKYKEVFEQAIPAIRQFQSLTPEPQLNEIETCLTGLYSKLLMKLQNKPLGKKTEEASAAFKDVLAYLSAKYRDMKEGKLAHNLN